jgi:hypothetical protein
MRHNKIGRPLGFRLSSESKRAISESKKGQKHKEETKLKISRSLHIYFRRKNPLSVEMMNMYCRFEEEDKEAIDTEIFEWINKVKDEIDDFEDVLTDKIIRNKCKVEITCGGTIEYFSHNINPEIILLAKEYCESNNVNIIDFFAEVT